MEVLKRFVDWIRLKEKLNSSQHIPPYFKEREIWWCALGENVGFEMNGKHEHFRRPVLILRKLDKFSFLAVPLTSKNKKGTWYVDITHGDQLSTAVISQIRHLDYRRLDKRMATLDSQDFGRVREACVAFIERRR